MWIKGIYPGLLWFFKKYKKSKIHNSSRNGAKKVPKEIGLFNHLELIGGRDSYMIYFYKNIDTHKRVCIYQTSKAKMTFRFILAQKIFVLKSKKKERMQCTEFRMEYYSSKRQHNLFFVFEEM